jgi:hypothetical protein
MTSDSIGVGRAAFGPADVVDNLGRQVGADDEP